MAPLAWSTPTIKGISAGATGEEPKKDDEEPRPSGQSPFTFKLQESAHGRSVSCPMGTVPWSITQAEEGSGPVIAVAADCFN